MPKYDLADMFNDKINVDYKIDCKFDFFFDGEEKLSSNMGYRIATRSPT